MIYLQRSKRGQPKKHLFRYVWYFILGQGSESGSDTQWLKKSEKKEKKKKISMERKEKSK